MTFNIAYNQSHAAHCFGHAVSGPENLKVVTTHLVPGEILLSWCGQDLRGPIDDAGLVLKRKIWPIFPRSSEFAANDAMAVVSEPLC